MTEPKSTAEHTQHARRTQVVLPEGLVGSTAVDYADAFEIGLPEAAARSPEELFRAALDEVSWMRRWVPIVHRHVLRFRLGPLESPDHVFGWRIQGSHADAVYLEADGPLVRGIIVGRKVNPATVVFTTFLTYVNSAPARLVWALVGPLHRRIAPYLLERGVARVEQAGR
jgi:hypothetical protein